MKYATRLMLFALLAYFSVGNIGNCQQRGKAGDRKDSLSAVIKSVTNYSVELLGIATKNSKDRESEVALAKKSLTSDLTGKVFSFAAIVESVDTSGSIWKLNIHRSELPIGENQRKQSLAFTGVPKKPVQQLSKGNVVYITATINKSTSKSLASMEVDLRASSFVLAKSQREVVKTFSTSDMLSDDRILFPIYVTDVRPITSPDEAAKATALIMEVDKKRIEREKAR